jgi:WhiB family transcriptional regulator, redox-sensing transcriptional regulator
VTADRPRHRTLPAPARFAARWREEAACRGARIEVFYPGRGETAGPARRACAQCPVRQQCLEFAVTNRIVYGIWGGLTGPERRALQSDWLHAARRDRDQAILAADAAGLTAEATARAFGLSRMTVTRIAREGNRGARAEPGHRAAQTPPLREGGR